MVVPRNMAIHHGPLSRSVKLRVAHAPRIPGTFPPPPTSKETASYRSRHESRHVHHARAVMHVGIDYPRWRGKRPWYSRCMHNPQVYVCGKRPIGDATWCKAMWSPLSEEKVTVFLLVQTWITLYSRRATQRHKEIRGIFNGGVSPLTGHIIYPCWD